MGARGQGKARHGRCIEAHSLHFLSVHFFKRKMLSRVAKRAAIRRRNQVFGLAARCSVSTVFKAQDTFTRRHIGPQESDVEAMLKVVGAPSLDGLTNKVVPDPIKFEGALWEEPAMSESELLADLKSLGGQNKFNYKSFIGQGYYGTKVPSVVVRNLLESPGWYTSYTPYQAEIAQGRLESLLNYQTMVMDLTGLPVANASLLDEATAVGETIGMALTQAKFKKNKFFIDSRMHPQTIAVAQTRADGMGAELVIGEWEKLDNFGDYAGVAVQYPDTNGAVNDYTDFFAKAKAAKSLTVCATDLLALCSLKPPGEMGAEVAVGSAQRFGVPLGYGGPHAAFLSCVDSLKRIIPGRIIGISKDVHGDPALRMALQTREQHIKREKATSNICTAQALLANMAAMYAVYHGPEGLKNISSEAHIKAKALAVGMAELGHTVVHSSFFDTVSIELKSMSADAYMKKAVDKGYNVRKLSDTTIAIALDETADDADMQALLECAGGAMALPELRAKAEAMDATAGLGRTSSFLTHPVFNTYQCEMEMQRYIYRLERKDLALNTAMIPLGSCTMKLNAASQMLPISWPEFGNLHPFVPVEQAAGYQEMFARLQKKLEIITGFDAVSLQPNAGSQGEYAGLRCIMEYHKSRGETQRNVCLIPISAHGTNPASAAMSKMKIVIVQCDAKGNVDMVDLKAKAEEHSHDLAAIMITYPSTHGVFEATIKEITKLIHDNGGQVYLDGANMNAQVGLCRPGDMGADVCHLNLHKTFAIPHGGGGPGMGPIGVKSQLAPFLPGHPTIKTGGETPFGTVSAGPWGSPSILPISYAYIEMLGPEGVRRSTQVAILAANYLRMKLKGAYPVLYTSENGFCAHEFILDLRPLKAKAGIEAEDVAKRLMDYGFHAPTMSFPVAGTLMIEPTESESLFELDRFAEAMLMIREEIREVEEGKADRTNNVLHNAPHTSKLLVGEWDYPYSREKAVFPTPWLRDNKYWPTVGRIDNVFGDRNFACSCAPVESYA